MSNKEIAMDVCPVCNGGQLTDVITINRIPIHCNLMWPSVEDALTAPKGDIDLVYCEDCGHLFNRAFDPDKMKYTQDYENSLHFSPRFQEYAHGLAAGLIERYDLYHKYIIEIGSGRGDFLKMLCELGDNRGLGFDPSYVEIQESNLKKQTVFIADFYSEKYAFYAADFICGRHVLEHIHKPGDFVSMIRKAIDERERIVLFFEVPNVCFTLFEQGIWDLIYEHYSYFSPQSLVQIFQRNRFKVLDLGETFNNQFLIIVAQPVKSGGFLSLEQPNGLDLLREKVDGFAAHYRAKVQAWKDRLATLAASGKIAIVWGAGSKGVMFLNTLGSSGGIQFVVDVNPRKQGKFIAGTGQEIIPPEQLRKIRPDIVIVMNSIYGDEIRTSLQEMDLSGEILLA